MRDIPYFAFMYKFPEPAFEGISPTALAICQYCALVQLHPHYQKAFNDPFSPTLFRHIARNGGKILDLLEDWRSVEAHIIDPGISTMPAIAHVVWRKGWIENQVLTEALNGAKQLVVVGSGLDTLAYRIHTHLACEGKEAPKIFEMDRAAILAAKAGIMQHYCGKLPRHQYLPLSAGNTSLIKLLLQAGLDPGEPTIILAELSMEYMHATERANVMRLFHFLLHPASRFIFSAVSARATLEEEPARLWKEAAEKRGEPIRWEVDPKSLRAFLLAEGLIAVDLLNERRMRRHYLQDFFGLEVGDVFREKPLDMIYLMNARAIRPSDRASIKMHCRINVR